MKNQPDFTDDYKNVLSEQLIHELKAINDGISGVQHTVNEMKINMATKEDIVRLERHLSLHDYVLDKHEERFADLESVVFTPRRKKPTTS